jgi:hypothetical protein
MLTTHNCLTAAGQAALKALGASTVSPHEAFWERLPLGRLGKLAHDVFRASVQQENCRRNRAPVARKPLKPALRKIAAA